MEHKTITAVGMSLEILIRRSIIAVYSSDMSQTMAFLPSLLAQTAVVPEPAMGLKTKSSSLVVMSISLSNTTSGF